ncbi:MAG: D-amino acid dehydrogenase [Candidatus Thioglobus sp.]|uniref:D-amino acid dehydrogenase n=1 Tax=Candidatus Thioglobus sp. TaxID=2026721 RepID=UPI002607A3B0|nr:D-amino acid dehydrogenase [Candidatus Thioglobus sp.]MDC9726888.1 D-amino acid dehydrogenase [Candidatus Thioglobus sp.]
MKVIVAGSGIIGIASAYYLAKAGHEVTVIEQESESALGTSFANAGQLSYGMSSPWAGPGIPIKAMKWLVAKYAPLVINPKLTWLTIKFLFKILKNCTAGRYKINKSRMVRISQYSKQAIAEVVKEHGFDFELRSHGLLQVFRTQAQLEAAQKDMAVLDAYQVKYQKLDVAGCIEAEPALVHVKDKLTGGLRYLEDQSANCFLFASHLTQVCKAMGVKFDFNVSIEKIKFDRQKVTGIQTDKGDYTADKYVIALGSDSADVLSPLGIHLPVYPVKGYSITMPVKRDLDAPQGTLMDETYKVAITRLGDFVRVAGIAELTGYDKTLSASGDRITQFVLKDLFPKAVEQVPDDHLWAGLRPMTPDGTPIIGKTPYNNLLLNTGHGTLGWTMSLGSGKIINSIVSGETPEIDIEGLDMFRYQ